MVKPNKNENDKGKKKFYAIVDIASTYICLAKNGRNVNIHPGNESDFRIKMFELAELYEINGFDTEEIFLDYIKEQNIGNIRDKVKSDKCFSIKLSKIQQNELFEVVGKIQTILRKN